MLENQMISTRDLAKRWKLHPRTLDNWRQQSRGPSYVKIGSTIMYRLEDVIEYELKRIVKVKEK